MTKPTALIRLGFEVDTGAPVEIPLAHIFACGQTQNSGKTTALRAIVERSGRRALAFITKRGEMFEGRRIRPYLPREGDQPMHWRMVEVILAGAVDQKNLKWERIWIINAAKGAYSLEDVQANVRRLRDKTKNEKAKDVYTLLDEYLEIVLPQMRSLDAADTLDLQPGLNVMDLSAIAGQAQAMVMRAALERINHHEVEILTVLPEAWEFAPLSRSTPVKPEAEVMVRKGAAEKVQNFLLCDSQDIAGVSPVVRQGSSVWLFGVQRELNELKRAIKMMPVGVKRPKADDVATLGLGQFFVCFGTHAIKTYVQPVWMPEDLARQVATGAIDVRNASAIVQPSSRWRPGMTSVGEIARALTGQKQEDSVTKDEAARLTRENAQLKADNANLRHRLEALEKGSHERDPRHPQREPEPGRTHAPSDTRAAVGSEAGDRAGPRRGPAEAGARAWTAEQSFDNEALYQAIKARLIEEAPAILRVIADRPELEVSIERRTITAEGSSTLGRVARLIRAGYFEESQRFRDILKELERTGTRVNNKSLSIALQDLVVAGFLTKESVDRYRAVPEMTVRVVEAA